MQSNALEQARLDAAARAQTDAVLQACAMRSVAQRHRWEEEHLVRRSHKLVEAVICAFIASTMTALALYNAALWLTR